MQAHLAANDAFFHVCLVMMNAAGLCCLVIPDPLHLWVPRAQ